jgi:hypothetical protein
MIGMFAVVERYVKVDHAAEWNEWGHQIDYMRGILKKISGVETGYVPRDHQACSAGASTNRMCVVQRGVDSTLRG